MYTITHLNCKLMVKNMAGNQNGRTTTPPKRTSVPPKRNSIPPKAAPEHPSVRENVVPAIRKALGSGETGKAIIEGLQLLENNLNDITRGLETDTDGRMRNLRNEVSTAARVSREASKHVDELSNTVRQTTLGLDSAEKDAAKAQRLAEQAATKDEYNALKGRVDETEKGLNSVKHELKVVAESMTHEVSVVGEDGRSEQKTKKGKELLAHLVAEVENQKAALGTYGDKLDEVVKTAEQASRDAEEAKDLLENANQLLKDQGEVITEGTNNVTEKVEAAVAGFKACIAEAFENIDGKLQLIGAMLLADDYVADDGPEAEARKTDEQKALEVPSFKEKEKG